MVDHARAATRERYLMLVIVDLVRAGMNPADAVRAAPFELVDDDAASLWERVGL